MAPPIVPFRQRFWSYVDKNGPLHPRLKTRCWLWTAGKIRGYGYFWLNGKTAKAYRLSYEMHKGPVPEGMCVLHDCDNPSCVNPQHLFVGTQTENRADCVKKGRHARGKTHGSVTKPGSGARGVRVSTAVLSDDLVREIKRAYIKGSKEYGTYGLAERFGVAQGTIHRVVSGKYWKHVS